MAQTSIVYEDVAPGAREAATLSMGDLQPFCNLEDVRGGVAVPRVATCEADLWRLDGTCSLMPDSPVGAWGAWSRSLCEADGVFATPPVLTLSWGQQFSSVGLTLVFDQAAGDWCRDLELRWYRGEVLLDRADFFPDGPRYACIREVRSFDRLQIRFRAMARPHRYLKLSDAIYGIVRHFEAGELREVNLFQAAAAVGEALEVDTLELSLSSRDPVPYLFQRKQPLTVLHRGNSQGTFYITESTRTGPGRHSLSAVSRVALLEEGRSHRGGIYQAAAFGALVGEILQGHPHWVEPELAALPVSGWLPVASRRENLYQVAFAVGAMVSTAGGSALRLFLPPSGAPSVLDGDQVFEGAQVETASLVTAVEVTAHRYAPGTAEVELFSGVLDGEAEVLFTQPAHGLSVTGGSVVDSGANFAVLRGTGGAVRLTGRGYGHTTHLVTVRNPLVTAGDIENVVQVQDATLVGPDTAEAVAQRLYRRYCRRETVKAGLVLDNQRPGDRVRVPTAFDGEKTGMILSLDCDLARKRYGEAVILCDEG